ISCTKRLFSRRYAFRKSYISKHSAYFKDFLIGESRVLSERYEGDTKRLGVVDATRFPEWRPYDPHWAQLETLQDAAAPSTVRNCAFARKSVIKNAYPKSTCIEDAHVAKYETVYTETRRYTVDVEVEFAYIIQSFLFPLHLFNVHIALAFVPLVLAFIGIPEFSGRPAAADHLLRVTQLILFHRIHIGFEGQTNWTNFDRFLVRFLI
ncbi:hypothetical protein CSKR_202907, partial [Clonorchis sinensis]